MRHGDFVLLLSGEDDALGPVSIPVNIYGVGSAITDYIIPINLHRGTMPAVAKPTAMDVFLGEQCNTDFSDVRFLDANGNRLQYYIHNHGNYEFIHSELGQYNFITAAGKIVSSNIPGVTLGIAESADNGATWTVIYASAASIVGIDPTTGNYFACVGNTLKRSTDAGHTTWATVIDMAAVTGIVLPYGFAVDAAGTIFVGRYQSDFKALIWRSLDHGATWEIIYPENVLLQHIHGLAVDPYTGYLYAGVDGSALIRSTNATDIEVAFGDVTWETLAVSDATSMLFGDGWRMFSEESEYLGPPLVSTVLRTTDDVTFTSEITDGQRGSVIRKVGGSIYLLSSNQYHKRYTQILKRSDDGSWRSIWVAKYFDPTANGNSGLREADQPGTPTGETDSQLLLGVNTPGYLDYQDYRSGRLYDGGSHYQALVYVKVPSIPADGCTLTVRCGNPSSHSHSTTAIYPAITQVDLLTHLKIDEGSGTAILDSSGNSKNAVLTPGAGSWLASGGRFVGGNYPGVVLPGVSYHFAGDGYIEITGSDTDAALQFTNNFAFSVWIRTTNQSVQWVIGKGAAAGNHWSLSSDTGGVGGYLTFTYGAANTRVTFVNTGPIADGSWHMVAITINSSNQLTAVIDGVDFGPYTLNPTITANDGAVRIGADTAGLQPFIGDIDDIQIYNVAKTADEFRQIYEDRMTVLGSEPGVDLPTTGAELCLNGGFEDGDATTLANWTGVGVGTQLPDTTTVRFGARSAALTEGASANCQIYQAFSVTAGASYWVSFWTYGNGTKAGRYGIYDATHSAYIIAATTTNCRLAKWVRLTKRFTAPDGCNSIRIVLLASGTNGAISLFDCVSVKAAQ